MVPIIDRKTMEVIKVNDIEITTKDGSVIKGQGVIYYDDKHSMDEESE